MQSTQVLYILSLLAMGAAVRDKTPVEKVVGLLKDLKAKSVADGEREDKTYNKYACWCETTTKTKAADIVTASADLRKLGQQILKFKGKVATLAAEIVDLDAQIKTKQDQQRTATDLRTKRNGIYQAMQAETKETMSALEKAVGILQVGTNNTSLLQADSAARAMSAVKSVLDVIPEDANINNDHLAFLSEFMTNGARYAPQSATIQGILTDMYAEFAANLEKATMAEAKQNKNYETVMNSAETGAKDAQTIKSGKEKLKAEAAEDLADTTETYDSTTDAMKANIAFFDETKKACTAKHTEYTERSRLRGEEAAGIDRALVMLTSDTARQLFADAIKPGAASPSFLQVASDDTLAVASKVYSMLKAQATKGKSLRLAMIAVRARTAKAGHFDAVIKSIDTMVGTLDTEAASDRTKKDQCNKQYQTIAQEKGDYSWKIETNEAVVDKLDTLIGLRTEEKAAAVKQRTASEAFRAKISGDRIAENGLFVQAKADDTSAITLLTSAQDALSQFFTDNKIEMGAYQALIQGDAAPEEQAQIRLSGKDQNKGQSKAILSLMKYIITDLQDEIVSDVKAEAKSQTIYVEANTTAAELETDLNATISDIDNIVAAKGGEKTTELAAFNSNTGKLNATKTYEASIKTDCDWIKTNFDGRAVSRQAEKDGLVAAKELLAGKAAAASLVQLKTPEAKPIASEDKLANIRFLGVHD